VKYPLHSKFPLMSWGTHSIKLIEDK
jgi:hypothetical protein